MNVQSDFDRGASFAGLVSYAWEENPEADREEGGLGFDNEIMARRIERMIHAGFRDRGYVRAGASSGRPDFLVSYRMLASEEVDQVRSSYPIGHGGHGFGHGGHGFGRGGHGGHGGHGFGTSGYARDVVQCVVMLDIRDPGTNRLIWRGWARWQMDEEPSVEKVAQHIERAIDEILSKFPPGRGSKMARVVTGP